MRTRHILTALALPALFAACTADEFETVSQDNGLQERAKLSKDFTLMTGVPETRYAAEGGSGISFNFEQGDRIGAAIIDQYNTVTPDDPKTFEVIYSLAGNNPFEYQGNDEWKSNTELGIGHYMFVFPYNSKDNGRGAVSYELPVIQEMYTDENGEQVLNAAIEKGNKAVATTVLYEDDLVADISLKNLFTYPKLTINFDNGEKVTTVSQIVLKANNTDDAFIVKGGFNHKVVAEMFDPSNKADDILNKKYYNNDGGKVTTPYVHWDEVGTYDFLITSDKSDYSTASAYITAPESERTSKYIIVKFPKNTKVKLQSNTDNKYVEARIMMPSIDDFSALTDEYTLYVYTDNGVYNTNFNENAFSFSDTTDKEKIKNALRRNQSNGLTLKALNAGNKEGDAGTIVTSLEDWNALVAKYGKTKQDQTIIVVGDGFAFDETAEWPETCTFTINSDVKVKDEVEMENVVVAGTVNVEKGATLTVNNTIKANKILNEGTVEVVAESDKDNKNDAYAGVVAIENKGILNVAEKANATFELTNQKGATMTNNGTVEVSDDANESEPGNFGTITNNGILRTNGFTNQKIELNNAKNQIVNVPTITNATGARILAVSGVLTNYAKLVNEGTLTCRNERGEIVNAEDNVSYDAEATNLETYPILDSKEDAITYITKNEAGATIVVYSDDPANLTIGTTGGVVEFDAPASTKSVDVKDSYVNRIIANNDLTLADGTLNTLVIANDVELTVGKTAGINNLDIQAGELTLAGNVTVATSLNVEKNAQMTVPEGTTFILNGEDYSNEGRILVGGTFKAEKVQRDESNVEDNGSENAQIIWKKSSADEAKDAYKAALERMVQAWMLDNYRTTWATVEDMKSEGWLTSTGATELVDAPTWKSLAEAAYKAYQEWIAADAEAGDEYGKINGWYNQEIAKDYHGLLAEIIGTYKSYGTANQATAIAAAYPDNSWIGNTVYTNEIGATAKLSDIKDGSSNAIDAKFLEEIKTIAEASIKVSATEDKTDLNNANNKAIWLTLQGLEVKNVDAEWVPDYSYINTYKTSDEYIVMDALKNKTANFGSWFDTYKTDLSTISGVKKAMAAIKDVYDGKKDVDDYTYVKNEITKSGLYNYVEKVLSWNYTKKQIAKLNNEVQ
mgnify:CR=1 FL=1